MSSMLDSFAPDVDLTADPPVEDEAVIEAPVEPPVEAQVEEKVEPKAEEPKQPKMVPLDALHESRAKLKEWREKAETIERESAERFRKLESRLERLANPPPAIPDFDENPAGHLKYQLDTTQAELKATNQTIQESRQQQEAVEFERQIATSTQAAEQVFAKDHPDYLQAVQHLQNIADKNLEMMGVEDPIARQAQIRKDALAMSFKALQMGKSPAEVAYQLAMNYGYKAATKEQGEAAKKIATLQEGQKAAVSMPSGGAKQSGLTLAALESMDDDEFNKVVDDPSAWSKLIRQMQ